MDFPRLRIESECSHRPMPQPQQYEIHICNLHQSSWQCCFLNPLREAGIKPASLWMLVRFISTEPQWELQWVQFFQVCFPSYTCLFILRITQYHIDSLKNQDFLSFLPTFYEFDVHFCILKCILLLLPLFIMIFIDFFLPFGLYTALFKRLHSHFDFFHRISSYIF